MTRRPCKNYEKLHEWELYAKQLRTELRQSLEEGLDLEKYLPLFDAVIAMPTDEKKEKMADVLFEIISEAPLREDYAYREPSDPEGIFAACDTTLWKKQDAAIPSDLRDHVRGAW